MVVKVHSLSALLGLTFKIWTLCFLYYRMVLTINTITSSYSGKWFGFVTERRSVYCEVRTECFDIIHVNPSSLHRQNLYTCVTFKQFYGCEISCFSFRVYIPNNFMWETDISQKCISKRFNTLLPALSVQRMSKTKEGESHIRFIQMRYCVRRNSDCREIKECDELCATPGLWYWFSTSLLKHSQDYILQIGDYSELKSLCSPVYWIL